MTVHSPVGDFIARQVRVRRVDLALAALAGMVTTASATWLLGLSNEFQL